MNFISYLANTLGTSSIFRGLKSCFLVTLSILISGCGIMQQTTYPAASQSTDNALASVVRIVPINANTILDIKTPKPEPKSSRIPAPRQNWSYTIGPGDILSIVVWDHPQITSPAGSERSPAEAGNWVSPEGTIFYPYIGEVEVAGKTINEVRELITNGLRSVIPRPQVDITVASFASQNAQITGAITSPGPVSLTQIPVTLFEAITARDGALPEANIENISLIRNNEKYTINLRDYAEAGNVWSNPQLYSGDVVVIPRNENNQVYVLGEINSPGIVPLDNQSLSLTEALAASGGLNKITSNASGIFVLRSVQANNVVDVFQLDVTDPTALLLATRFSMAKGDVIYATSAPATRWNRLLNNLVPSLGALSALLVIGN